MKLIFAGTPEFAQVALAQLHAAGHEIALVLTQPDRPAGRGMKLQASSVKQFALAQGLALAQPRSLRLDGKFAEDAKSACAQMQALQADAMVVAAYGLILPQWVLDLPRLGCFNIHASLLPRWRGAAPIHRAIEAGDNCTGITIMQMDAGLDTGAMLLSQSLPISPDCTTGSLHDALADMGAALMLQVLAQAGQGQLRPVAQTEQGIRYAEKIEKHEARIDWTLPAQQICQRVRAFNPFPVAGTTLNGEALKVWSARVSEESPSAPYVCGQVMAVEPDGIAIAAMDSIVILMELQRPGGKRLGVADFLRGNAIAVGQVLGAAP